MIRARATLLVALALGCAPQPPQTEPAPPLRGIDFRADLEVLRSTPARLATTVTMHNRRPTPATLTFPIACVGLLRAYDGERPAPVWEQHPAGGCPADTLRVDLDPGQAREMSLTTVSTNEVLGRDLPEGTYRFTVLLVPDGHVLEIEAGDARIARGPDTGG
jgi:hypothetical protein